MYEELGLFDELKPVNYTVKNLSESFKKTGRLDSEYYSEKYEKIINKLVSYGCSKLECFVDSYTTGYPYSSESYVEKDGVSLIKISNINNFKLDISNATMIPKKDIDLSIENVVHKNDILISMSGTIGNSCMIQEDIKAVVNQRIMKIKSKNINPIVLFMIIDSYIEKSQLERIQTGCVQANISPKDILKIKIPYIKANIQEKIGNLLVESENLRNQSKLMLEKAVKLVELAIEEGEEKALALVENCAY